MSSSGKSAHSSARNDFANNAGKRFIPSKLSANTFYSKKPASKIKLIAPLPMPNTKNNANKRKTDKEESAAAKGSHKSAKKINPKCLDNLKQKGPQILKKATEVQRKKVKKSDESKPVSDNSASKNMKGVNGLKSSNMKKVKLKMPLTKIDKEKNSTKIGTAINNFKRRQKRRISALKKDSHEADSEQELCNEPKIKSPKAASNKLDEQSDVKAPQAEENTHDKIAMATVAGNKSITDTSDKVLDRLQSYRVKLANGSINLTISEEEQGAFHKLMSSVSKESPIRKLFFITDTPVDKDDADTVSSEEMLKDAPVADKTDEQSPQKDVKCDEPAEDSKCDEPVENSKCNEPAEDAKCNEPTEDSSDVSILPEPEPSNSKDAVDLITICDSPENEVTVLDGDSPEPEPDDQTVMKVKERISNLINIKNNVTCTVMQTNDSTPVPAAETQVKPEPHHTVAEDHCDSKLPCNTGQADPSAFFMETDLKDLQDLGIYFEDEGKSGNEATGPSLPSAAGSSDLSAHQPSYHLNEPPSGQNNNITVEQTTHQAAGFNSNKEFPSISVTSYPSQLKSPVPCNNSINEEPLVSTQATTFPKSSSISITPVKQQSTLQSLSNMLSSPPLAPPSSYPVQRQMANSSPNMNVNQRKAATPSSQSVRANAAPLQNPVVCHTVTPVASNLLQLSASQVAITKSSNAGQPAPTHHQYATYQNSHEWSPAHHQQQAYANRYPVSAPQSVSNTMHKQGSNVPYYTGVTNAATSTMPSQSNYDARFQQHATANHKQCNSQPSPNSYSPYPQASASASQSSYGNVGANVNTSQTLNANAHYYQMQQYNNYANKQQCHQRARTPSYEQYPTSATMSNPTPMQNSMTSASYASGHQYQSGHMALNSMTSPHPQQVHSGVHNNEASVSPCAPHQPQKVGHNNVSPTNSCLCNSPPGCHKPVPFNHPLNLHELQKHLPTVYSYIMSGDGVKSWQNACNVENSLINQTNQNYKNSKVCPAFVYSRFLFYQTQIVSKFLESLDGLIRQYTANPRELQLKVAECFGTFVTRRHSDFNRIISAVNSRLFSLAN